MPWVRPFALPDLPRNGSGAQGHGCKGPPTAGALRWLLRDQDHALLHLRRRRLYLRRVRTTVGPYSPRPQPGADQTDSRTSGRGFWPFAPSATLQNRKRPRNCTRSGGFPPKSVVNQGKGKKAQRDDGHGGTSHHIRQNGRDTGFVRGCVAGTAGGNIAPPRLDRGDDAPA